MFPTIETTARPLPLMPVFPLAGAVLFPRTSINLRLFEPRYRAMFQDACAGEGLIVVSLQTTTGIEKIGTVGSLAESRSLDDGSFEIRLEGVQRVALQALTTNKPYDQARVASRPERAGSGNVEIIDQARLELVASYGSLRSMLHGNEPLVRYQDLPFETAVNITCARMPVEASMRQLLLREDTLLGRQKLAMEFLSTVIDALSWLKAMKGNASTIAN